MSTTLITSLLKRLGRIWSSEEDWEVGRATLSCHLHVDLTCQETREFPAFTVFRVHGRKDEVF